MNSFYTPEELLLLGFKKLGDNVLISRKASFYNAHEISIGSHVRIDDFCILSGKITLGSFIHISAYCVLYGQYHIEMEDYTGLSARCTVYSASDDFSGDYLISPMVSKEYTNVQGGEVTIKQYSQIGASCVILPNLMIHEGVVVGSMSLINKSLDAWGIYAGIPIKRIKDRKQGLLKYIN
jgi:galactoside O-acetyltransferase